MMPGRREACRPVSPLRWARLGRFDRLLLALRPGARVLDVGCSDCSSLIPLKALRPDVGFHGVDIKDLRGRPPAVLDSYARVDLDRESLPFEPEAFDCIRIAHVLEHLSRPSLLFSGVRNLLAVGGVIHVSAPNERSLLVPSLGLQHGVHGPLNFYDDPTHLRPWTSHALYCLVEAAGFGADDIEVGLERTPYWFLRSVPTLAMGIMRCDRQKVVSAVSHLVGWTSYAAARRR